MSQWIYYVFVLEGPKQGEGISVYADGILANQTTTKESGDYPSGSGRMVIGRRNVDVDDKYASVTVDELLLWNRKLSQPEVQELYSQYGGNEATTWNNYVD